MPGVHFHDLRHLADTVAATNGATTKELMARMGHSSPRAALIYQHAAVDRDKAIAEALSALVWPVAPVQLWSSAGGTRRQSRCLGSPVRGIGGAEDEDTPSALHDKEAVD